MRIGKLSERVTIERRTVARDANGGERVTWAVLATRWASVLPLTGRELFAAQSAHSEVTGKIMFRAPVDVRPDDRIMHGGKVYAVQAVLDAEAARREIVCMVSEGLSDGR